jgi:hypothetical protein
MEVACFEILCFINTKNIICGDFCCKICIGNSECMVCAIVERALQWASQKKRISYNLKFLVACTRHEVSFR